MAVTTAVLSHNILPHRFLTPPSVTLTPFEAKFEFQRRHLPLQFIHKTQTQKCNFPIITSCLSTSTSSPKVQFNPSTRLFVSGLSFRTTEESLTNAFKNFGELVEVNLVMDNIAKRPRGFAFLKYANEEESKKAIEGMHGKFLDGRVIFVEIAKPRSELRKDPSVDHAIDKINSVS